MTFEGMLYRIGKSVAGNTSKIHLAVDSNGNPVDFEVTGGEVHDVKVAPELVSTQKQETKISTGDY
jgi:hypothetical protein